MLERNPVPAVISGHGHQLLALRVVAVEEAGQGNTALVRGQHLDDVDGELLQSHHHVRQSLPHPLLSPAQLERAVSQTVEVLPLLGLHHLRGVWPVPMCRLCHPEASPLSLAVQQLLPLLRRVRRGHHLLHVLRQGRLLSLRGEAGPGHGQGGQLGGQSLLLLHQQVVRDHTVQ